MTAKYNLFDKCYTQSVNGKDFWSQDTQCNERYVITKDYFGKANARTISVQLAQGQFCALQIVNQIDTNITGRIVATSSNKANITYKSLQSIDRLFYNTSDNYDMRQYTWMKDNNFNLSNNEGVSLIGVNAYTNGSPVFFEIYYQGGLSLSQHWLLTSSLAIGLYSMLY
ncbi:hypothetical protein FGO68_gene16570 [Halteria grandinella]|uniref:Uncharacterized protein n=1 Tax=Halteria grandinella TaxID=5974 RepID=A0A8J8NJJ8_HALGN|nr:hypothetical protein FGO68_gene16570 [Halteria grandinella]